jgi:hypothetical protein
MLLKGDTALEGTSRGGVLQSTPAQLSKVVTGRHAMIIHGERRIGIAYPPFFARAGRTLPYNTLNSVSYLFFVRIRASS